MKRLSLFVLLIPLASFAADVPAIYEVPVPAGYEHFARFELSNFQHEETTNSIRISYDLPAELVGFDGLRIELSGDKNGDQAHLSGANGEADCLEDASEVYTCHVRYSNFSVDPAGVESRLKAVAGNASELSARRFVAESFAKEPIGIVIYR